MTAFFSIGVSTALRALQAIAAGCLLAGSAFAADAPKITYEDHVRPLFENKCFSCHNPDKAKGGLDLTTYSATLAGGSSGQIVISGQPGDSRLFQSIARTAEPFMPPEGDPLPKPNLDTVAAWISGGLLENKGSKAKKAKPSMSMELAKPSTGKPEGPPPMPEHLVLEPEVATARAFAPSDIAASPWAPLVALSAPKQVLLYHTDSLQLQGVLPFPEGLPENLAFSRNGQLVLAGGGRGGKSGRVVGWEVKTGKRVFEIGNEFDSVLAADISADHSLVALGGPSRRVKIYATATGEEVANIKKHTDWVTALSFSPDGVLVASGDRNGGVFVWEAGTGNPFYTLKAHTKAITAISWRADSNVVATASEDGTARLWEMKEGKQIKNWTAHAGGVTDLAYTGNGHLVSCGRDKHAKIWDGNGTQKTATKDFADIPVTTCLSHNGARYITADWSGAVKVFNTADSKALGRLVANPPTIASRIAQTTKAVNELQKQLDAAKAKEQQLAATAAAKKTALDQASTKIGGLTSQRDSQQQALNTANAAAAESQRQRDASAAKKDTAGKEVARLEAELKATSSDAAKAETLKPGLAAARQSLANLTAELQQKDQALAKARNATAEATKKFAAAKAAADAAVAAKTAAGPAHVAAAKALQDHRVSVQNLAKKVSTAQHGQKFWAAAEINRQRYLKREGRGDLNAEVEAAQQTMKDAQQAELAAKSAAQQAEAHLKTSTSAVTAANEALTKAKARLPDLEWDLRLAKVIANQKQAAAKNIAAVMTDAPDSMKPKIQKAIADANKAVADAGANVARIDDLLKNSIARATDASKKAQAALAAARQDMNNKSDLAVKRASEVAAVSGKRDNAASKLAAHDSEIAALKARYLAALPKK